MKDTKYLEILKAPVITEKSENEKANGKYTFKVDPRANKLEIKEDRMDVKTLIGRKVTHKAFGDGIVVDIDKYFEASFAESLSYGDRGDLRQYWSVIKPETESIVANTKRLPLLSWGLVRRLERVLFLQLKELSERQRRTAQK